MDGRTDGQRENSIPYHKHSLRGYKYTFNSTVNVEIMSKMFENINNSNFVAKYLKENAYRII